jgi:hypothetical protein
VWGVGGGAVGGERVAAPRATIPAFGL